MLIPNHPDDERLSALASGDPEAVADSVLSEHVASCLRCTDTVAELGALRASLAELPDLRPHRPLQLLPPVDRRAFARRPRRWLGASVLRPDADRGCGARAGRPRRDDEPAPRRNGISGAAPSESESATHPAERDHAEATDGDASMRASRPRQGQGPPRPTRPRRCSRFSRRMARPEAYSGSDTARLGLTDDRPLWPMLLFAGVALMIAAALLRWILAPRAG